MSRRFVEWKINILEDGAELVRFGDGTVHDVGGILSSVHVAWALYEQDRAQVLADPLAIEVRALTYGHR